MTFSIPPIVRQAERLLFEIEKAVSSFSRYQKYSFGTDLRDQARSVCMQTHRAWRHHGDRPALIAQLIDQIDEFKLLLQLGSRLHAFASFRQYEMLARLSSDVGKQAGGWKKQHPMARNEQPVAAAQRGKILSTSAASICEANA